MAHQGNMFPRHTEDVLSEALAWRRSLWAGCLAHSTMLALLPQCGWLPSAYHEPCAIQAYAYGSSRCLIVDMS